jgi:hypothetical protein
MYPVRQALTAPRSGLPVLIPRAHYYYQWISQLMHVIGMYRRRTYAALHAF